ncbi:glycosyltransferase family 34 protein [Melanomma pulvis-pyrius CBS 109.77]|uniref:Glycosyltransferase family 34 protein n=1 Tax=Melanomma pulvis-pyrius CBS 109.77 TaxID=1314802 RepID=A0A6A6X781_9PLEO|nr:glycosyltransferase family 34 protein [Melanomma pulvis-pyrius CBS 109.77]
MLVRSLRVSPAILVFLALCAFLGWQFRQGHSLAAHQLSDLSLTKDDSSSSKRPRIAVVTFITDEKSYVHTSLKNKDHYARRHGYDFIVDYEAHTDRGTTYWKFNMMERLIKTGKWDWIWWMDFDTLITNTDIKVADIIEETLKNATDPKNIDFLTTHDCNGLNTGSFIVRGHERSIKFLHDIYAISDREKTADHGLSEQDAMARLIKSDPISGDRTIQVPQWKLNAFPQEIACFDESNEVWKPGMFVIHFAGAWAHVKGEDPTGQLMKKYKDEIVWGDWKEFYV